MAALPIPCLSILSMAESKYLPFFLSFTVTAQSRMANHIDDLEAVMAGRKRMLYGHARWSPDKHRKHEWPGVNPTNALNVSIDPVPHPPVAKKSLKAYGLCEHQRQRRTYKDCGDSRIVGTEENRTSY